MKSEKKRHASACKQLFNEATKDLVALAKLATSIEMCPSEPNCEKKNRFDDMKANKLNCFIYFFTLQTATHAY